jgi:hypothetical protein
MHHCCESDLCSEEKFSSTTTAVLHGDELEWRDFLNPRVVRPYGLVAAEVGWCKTSPSEKSH